jgi:hypothetical protein
MNEYLESEFSVSSRIQCTPNEVFEPLLGFTNTWTQTDKQSDTVRCDVICD